MELQVYSSVAGELVDLVRRGKPMSFVPYTQALQMQEQILQLQSQLTELESKLVVKYGAGFDHGIAMGKQISQHHVDAVVDQFNKLAKVVEAFPPMMPAVAHIETKQEVL